jgi:hypothetical protein
LVILLFLGCFVGVTLTLFKSDLLDGSDGTIGIITTSGSVEIDIVDLSGKTLQNKALALMTSSGATDSEKVLFEPGATFYTQGFKIKNTGDIPVNFSLSVSKDDKIDMKEFHEAFELWILKEGDDFLSSERITDFKVNGLAAGESSATYYLFIKMKETASNEFRGKTYTGIGITVYAVQGNAQLN